MGVMNVRRLKDDKDFAVKAPLCLLYRDDTSKKPVYDDVPLAMERSLAFERVLHRDLVKTFSTVCSPLNAKDSNNFTLVYPEELSSFIDAIDLIRNDGDPVEDNRLKEDYREREVVRNKDPKKFDASPNLLSFYHSLLTRVLDLHSAGYIHGNLNPKTIFVSAKDTNCITFDWTHVRRLKCKMPYTLPHSSTLSIPLLLSYDSDATPKPTDDLEALLYTFYLGIRGSTTWPFDPGYCRHAFVDGRLSLIEHCAKTKGEKSAEARILKGLALLESSGYSPKKLLSLFSPSGL
jgi:hypothetical protein